MPDVGIELEAACMRSGQASDRATVPGLENEVRSPKSNNFFPMWGWWEYPRELDNFEKMGSNSLPM